MDSLPLLSVKFRHPPSPPGLIARPQLCAQLDQSLEQRFILVSAPAGYGKTTLVSAWLQTWPGRSAWLSLDQKDNDFTTFVSYLLAAIETMFPDAVQETQALLHARSIPRPSVIVTTLAHELDGIDQDFVLVLDDLHFIQHAAIYNLLAEVLHYAPHALHLVILTRQDPPLPLARMRVRCEMIEIRTSDLRFTRAETVLFLHHLLGAYCTEEIITWLDTQTEGWVTGLRLAVLFMRHRGSLEQLVPGFSVHNRYILDYFVSEVLAHQPEAMRSCLLHTSILDRFCASLCEAVCAVETDTQPPGLRGQAFIAWLEQNSLFIEPLDDQGTWYRYHHLFRHLLQHQLEQQYGPDYRAALHRRASMWFLQQAFLEEALHHMLDSSDLAGAVQIVARHRHILMNHEQWLRLHTWVYLFPRELVETTPELLIVDAWVAQNRLQVQTVAAVLDQIEALLAHMPADATPGLRGEVNVLRSACFFWAGDLARTLVYAQRALEALPHEHFNARTLTCLFVYAGHLDRGDLETAASVRDQALHEDLVHMTPAYMRKLVGSCTVSWIHAGQQRLMQDARTILTLAQNHLLPDSIGWANYFLGSVQYLQDDLSAAEQYFSAAVQQRYAIHVRSFVGSSIGLALTYLARGQVDDAHTVIKLATAFVLEIDNTFVVPFLQAFQAELALRHGDLAAAYAWSTQFNLPLVLPFAIDFFSPHITLVKVLLAQNTPASLDTAADWLVRLHAFCTTRHLVRMLIDVLALQALVEDKHGQEQAALAALEQAVMLAQPPGYIRPFVDLGPRLYTLLAMLAQRGVALDFVSRIRAAFPPESVPVQAIEIGSAVPLVLYSRPASALPRRESAANPPAPDMVESLTNREIDVLLLMEQRLTNKEIAQALGISVETVKQHTINVFRKLDVHNRRQAAARARALKLVPGG